MTVLCILFCHPLESIPNLLISSIVGNRNGSCYYRSSDLTRRIGTSNIERHVAKSGVTSLSRS